MEYIGHKLAIDEGMSQEHYAIVQCEIADNIEAMTKELEYNRKWYVSCLKCNKVFFKNVLIKGVCRNCTYPEKI